MFARPFHAGELLQQAVGVLAVNHMVVHQALLTAVFMYLVMAPVGYFSTPYLLTIVNAAPSAFASLTSATQTTPTFPASTW